MFATLPSVFIDPLLLSRRGDVGKTTISTATVACRSECGSALRR